MGSIISSSKSNYRKSKNPLTLIKLLQSKLLTTRQQVVTYLVVVVKITSLAKRNTLSHTHTYTFAHFRETKSLTRTLNSSFPTQSFSWHFLSPLQSDNGAPNTLTHAAI
uniref:(northern house mosquito) hypothetical protein n=1 Tax=Culex pipiens TaxID=7175 RepID=A0A8D8CPL9_CULPI